MHIGGSVENNEIGYVNVRKENGSIRLYERESLCKKLVEICSHSGCMPPLRGRATRKRQVKRVAGGPHRGTPLMLIIKWVP
jgi:hypothetical protein